jgi:hypothetical protein
MAIDVTLNSRNGVTLATSGKYCPDNISVSLPDTDKVKLIPENIKEGVSILGVEGSLTSEKLLVDCLIPVHCTKIAVGSLRGTATGDILFTLKDGYKWAPGANNNYSIALFRRTDSTASFQNLYQFYVGQDSAEGKTVGRGDRVYTDSPKGSSYTDQQVCARMYNNAAGHTFDFQIFLCDKSEHIANPSAQPEIINISDICDISGAELTA